MHWPWVSLASFQVLAAGNVVLRSLSLSINSVFLSVHFNGRLGFKPKKQAIEFHSNDSSKDQSLETLKTSRWIRCWVDNVIGSQAPIIGISKDFIVTWMTEVTFSALCQIRVCPSGYTLSTKGMERGRVECFLHGCSLTSTGSTIES